MVQRTGPFGRIAPRRPLPLDVSDIRPVIRIAHRLRGALGVRNRIIMDHELVLMLKGGGHYAAFSRTTRFEARHLLFVPPFVPHDIVTDQEGECEHIAVHFDFAPDMPPTTRSVGHRTPYEVRLTHGLNIPATLPVPPGHRIEAGLIHLVRRWEDDDPTGTLEATTALMDVLAELLRTRKPAVSATERTREAKLRRVLAMITAKPHADWSCAQLAQTAGLSMPHFTRLFRQWTGYSPVDYVRRQRIDHARRLLADVDLSIKEVAARCGFDDPYHFSRVFRKVDGLSPTEFRESVLKRASDSSIT